MKLTFYTGNVMEENHYYPFGLTLTSATNNSAEKNNYKLTTKELQPELGLNWYDFGARMMDEQIGRWIGIDPLSEKYLNISSYAYVADNPVKLFDPNVKKFGFIGPKIVVSGMIIAVVNCMVKMVKSILVK